jgi:purine-binding chemotaxis protein CheW
VNGVCVRVGVAQEHYALGVEHVLEVTEPGQLTPVPGAPSQVIGIGNVRGQVVPMLSVAALLGLPAEHPGRIVVAEHGVRRAGLAVASVLDVSELPDLSHETDSPFLLGAALIDGTLVGLLDVDAILASTQPLAASR